MMKMFLSIVCICFLLSACGLKGPLYEPSKQASAFMLTSPLFYRIA